MLKFSLPVLLHLRGESIWTQRNYH